MCSVVNVLLNLWLSKSFGSAGNVFLLTCEEECIGGCGEVWCGCPGWRWGLWELWWGLCPCGWWWPLWPWPWLWWWWPWCWYAWGGAWRCWCGCMWWWVPCSCRDDIISIMWPMEFMLPLAMAPGWCESAAFSLCIDKMDTKHTVYESFKGDILCFLVLVCHRF